MCNLWIAMRKRIEQNSRPSKKDVEIDVITENLLEFEHLIRKRQS
jgi:hypothetical protein